jgi:2-keto-4-pentenoate hydratase/2-oxohepta-3-ene-1,7-dioic acid hydratase in catechol pathway
MNMPNLKPDKIICVGRNYLKHAIEMGGEIPKEPLYFLKPASASVAVASKEQTVALPAGRGEVHHELELVLRVGETGGKFTFTHFTFGLDLTLRELQQNLKKAGQPWEKAKVFKNSAILGPWLALESMSTTLERPFELFVNGKSRQKDQGLNMRWKPEELLADLQHYFPLCDGDWLFTGTPEGVGPLNPGDRVKIVSLDFNYEFYCG